MSTALRNVRLQRWRIEQILVPSAGSNVIPFGDKPLGDITTQDLETLDAALMAVKPRQR